MGREKVETVVDDTLRYDLYDTLSHLLRRSHFHAEGLFTKSLGHHGVTSRQLALLVVVSQNPNVSQRRVSELIALDINTVSDLLRRMEKNGLVERRSSNEDGRAIQITLSEKGTSVLAAIHDDNQQYQAQLTEHLSEADVTQLKYLLRKLLDLPK
jgi:DNA-binding MarR family transcriptional regulator